MLLFTKVYLKLSTIPLITGLSLFFPTLIKNKLLRNNFLLLINILLAISPRYQNSTVIGSKSLLDSSFFLYVNCNCVYFHYIFQSSASPLVGINFSVMYIDMWNKSNAEISLGIWWEAPFLFRLCTLHLHVSRLNNTPREYVCQ